MILPPYITDVLFLAPINLVYFFGLIYIGHFNFLLNMSFRVGFGQVMTHVLPYYITKTSFQGNNVIEHTMLATDQ